MNISRSCLRGTSGLRGLLFLTAVVALGADPGPARRILNPYPQPENTRQALAALQAKQSENARTWRVYHQFRFHDRREASGITFAHQPVDDGAKTYKAVHYDHGNGLAAADVDQDGLIDLYFLNQMGGSELWRNLGRGRFENVTASAGVGLTDKVAVAASFADIDNDGWPDLFVSTVRMGNVLFRNRGHGRFEDISATSGIRQTPPAHGSGAAFFDYDRDGLLDLFVANVGVYTRNEKGRGGFYLGRSDAFQGWQFPARSEPSVLFRNRGGGQFEEVSARVDLVHRGWSGDVTFTDLNQDGFPDLYVPSMSGRDAYYENDQGRRFSAKTEQYFPRSPWGTMGLKFFDYNLDGRMDLFLTDMHSDMTTAQIKAGDVDQSSQFAQRKSDPWCLAEWTPAQQQSASNSILGNAFWENQGQNHFVEVSAKLGLETYWPWGMSVADLNADGYEDIVVTAGMGYPLRYAINSVFLNESGRRFVESEFVLGVEPRPGLRLEKEFFELDCSGEDRRHPLCRNETGRVVVLGATSSRASVAVDLDNDGDLDLAINEWNDAPQLLLSDLSEQRPVRFLKLQLRGTASNRDGLGATVRVHCGTRSYTRYHDGKSGYLSQSSVPIYFGLDQAERVDRIEVRWPSGKTQELGPDIPANQLLLLTEPR